MLQIISYATLFVFGLTVGYFMQHSSQPDTSDAVINAVIKLNTKSDIGEYQIRIEPDSAYIYDHGRIVGSCKHGNDGIDSVILKDNL